MAWPPPDDDDNMTHPAASHYPAATALIALSLSLPPALAGRPLGTDDASTAAPRNCQLEAWYQRSDGALSTTLAPACGIAEGLELDLGLTLPAQRQDPLQSGNLAFKWVPAGWASSTPLGDLALGLKASADFEHPADGGWRRADTTGLLLGSLQLGEQWAMHLNLGRGQWRPRGQASLQANLLNVAAVWTPVEQALLFAEWQGNNQPSDLGRPVRTVGGRWWLQKDKLGLDLTWGRAVGMGAPNQIGLGFGWYGLAY